MLIDKKKNHKITISYIYKVTIVCILIVTIPYVTAMLISGKKISNYILKSVQSRANQTVNYLNVTLSQYFKDVQELTILPLYNENVVYVLKNHCNENSKGYVRFSEKRIICSFLSGNYYQRNTLRNTKIYFRDGYFLDAGGSIYEWGDTDREWMDICDKDSQYGIYIIPWDGTIAVVHALREPMTNIDIGYIKVEIKKNVINDIITSVSLPEGSKLFIYNEFNQCIFPNEVSELDFEQSENSTEGYLTSYTSSNETDLQVKVMVSLDTMYKEFFQIVNFSVRVILIALLISWFFSIFASVRLAKPIIHLKKKMVLFGEGKLITRASVISNDEIGQLTGIFNQMAENIEKLIREVYESRVASKEAQISALQSQINPHFLYNTLETINMLAITDENYLISEAVSNLGWMMRYCVSNEEHFTKLENELQFVTAYYELQKLRYEQLRSLAIEVDSTCRDQRVPKLLLQPFVENIVQHGLNGKDVDIVLSVHIDEEYLYIYIQNNGESMSNESRARIKKDFANINNRIICNQNNVDKKTVKGYGLTNVHRRLRLLYGNECGVYLDENYTNGVKFCVKLKSNSLEDGKYVQGNDCRG